MTARRRTYGVSFSWKRAIGLSAEKAKISREIGIPLTRSGRERKIGRIVEGFFPYLLIAAAAAVAIFFGANK